MFTFLLLTMSPGAGQREANENESKQMFNSLQEKLESAFKNLKGQGRITELNIATTVKEIRRALVDADVNYKIAKEFTDKVKDKAIGEKVINAISPGQLMTKIVKDELAELMGGQEASLMQRESCSHPDCWLTG